MPIISRYGEPDLPPLVFLHGFLGTKADWVALMPALSQHFHCICIDLPGHGEHQQAWPTLANNQDTPLNGFTLCVSAIVASMDNLGIDKFHLYGYSLGGRIALHLAQTHPNRLHSLQLESCHPGLEQAKEKKARLQNDTLWADRLMRQQADEFLNLWYQQAVFADMDAKARKELVKFRANALNLHPKQVLQQVYLATSLGNQQPLWDVPAQLACPCHFFVGEYDSKFLALAEQWQSRAPIKLRVVKQAGHNVHHAAPSALIASLIHLLA